MNYILDNSKSYSNDATSMCVQKQKECDHCVLSTFLLITENDIYVVLTELQLIL